MDEEYNVVNISVQLLRRDEEGRPIAADGYPIGGLASVAEIVKATGLSRSHIYNMIQRGELVTKRFGRSVWVPWQSLREVGILDDSLSLKPT